MSLTSLASHWLSSWRAWAADYVRRGQSGWERCSQRERWFLQMCAAVLVLAAVGLLGVRPAWRTLEQASRQLPLLQEQAAQLDAVLLEIKALGRERAGMLSEQEADEVLNLLLSESGLAQSTLLERQVQAPESEATWSLSLEQAPIQDVLDYMARLPSAARVQVRQLNLARSQDDDQGKPGRVTGRIVLMLSKGEPS